MCVCVCVCVFGGGGGYKIIDTEAKGCTCTVCRILMVIPEHSEGTNSAQNVI